ncbi:MAG: hypothetical protein GEU92_19010 [Alphaproteobacteria bacterium]|nr:hypothetical protein [Alphaproteobacteria bacterium]
MKAYLKILSFIALAFLAQPAQAGFNGSGNCVRSTGVFTGAQVWQNTRDAGRAIRADDQDTHDNGLVDCIENTVTLDGQNTPSANLPMGTFKHTAVGNAAARDQYSAAGQVQDGDFLELGSVAGTDTITGSASPAISAYAAGQTFRFVAADTNTGATTLNVNAVGATAVQKLGAALVAGDITAGDAVAVYYDGTQFQMLSPARTPVLTAGGIATAALADNAVTLAKLEDGTEGDTLYYGASGAPTRLAVGTAGQVLAVNAGATAPEWADKLTSDTVQTATGVETEFDFTGIPAWVKRITIQLAGTSTSGTDDLVLLIGDSGGFETSGYLGSVSTGSVSPENFTAYFQLDFNHTAAFVNHGRIVLELLDPATNLWVASGSLGRSDAANVFSVGGSKALSGALTQVRITTVGGTDAIDAGSINILYE